MQHPTQLLTYYFARQSACGGEKKKEKEERPSLTQDI